MVIAAFQNGQTKVYTKSMHQFDKGQKLIVTGIALPNSFEVHMSNQKDGGMAYSCRGTLEGVLIPDALFVSGDYIYIWLYMTSIEEEGTTHAYDSDPLDEETIMEKDVGKNVLIEGQTIYEIVIPVIRRPVQLPTMIVSPESGYGYMVDENETLIPVSQ